MVTVVVCVEEGRNSFTADTQFIIFKSLHNGKPKKREMSLTAVIKRG